MANGNDKILTEQNLQNINTGLEAAEQAERILELAKQAGMDVSQFEARAKQSRAQLLRIKNTFFPGR